MRFVPHVIIILLLIIGSPLYVLGEVNCMDMYSNNIGMYMVTDGELRPDLYKEFWGEKYIETIKDKNKLTLESSDYSECHIWMIAFIWI